MTNDPDAPLPTDAELRMLHVLWRHGAQTVRQIHDRLRGERETTYTTVLKILQNMHGKGLVRRDESARSHVYEAAVDREWASRSFVAELTERVFQGSTAELVLRALSSKPATAEELDEIRAYLAELEASDG